MKDTWLNTASAPNAGAPNKDLPDPRNKLATHDARRERFVQTARQLFEEVGLSHTSVSLVTERMGVTRSLFYHYFTDKDALISAVLDSYVADFIEMLHVWNAQRKPGCVEDALDSMVSLIRRSIFTQDHFRKSLVHQENARLYLDFVNKIADQIARYMTETTVKDYEQARGLEIDHVYETFYVLILGLIGYMRSHANASNELLKDLIAQSLHISEEARFNTVCSQEPRALS